MKPIEVGGVRAGLEALELSAALAQLALDRAASDFSSDLVTVARNGPP